MFLEAFGKLCRLQRTLRIEAVSKCIPSLGAAAPEAVVQPVSLLRQYSSSALQPAGPRSIRDFAIIGAHCIPLRESTLRSRVASMHGTRQQRMHETSSWSFD